MSGTAPVCSLRPTLDDSSLFQCREAELSAWALPARELYTGWQHRYMMTGVDAIRHRSATCLGGRGAMADPQPANRVWFLAIVLADPVSLSASLLAAKSFRSISPSAKVSPTCWRNSHPYRNFSNTPPVFINSNCTAIPKAFTTWRSADCAIPP